MEEVDLVVVGTGWYGLAAAKTYLQVNPNAKIAVFEQAFSAGGVWAQERLYPMLKSNNVIGRYEYSDFPMDTSGLKPDQHIPGVVIHNYLTNYAKHFGVYDNIRFNTKVDSAEHNDEGGWVLTVSQKGSQISQVRTAKLIVATGLTSQPFVPSIPGSETFGSPIFHSKEFRAHAASLETTKTVCVLGGTKSAWDVVYAYASSGQKVNWIIRESGHGPIWMAPARVTPLKQLLEGLAMTRFLTWFSPCAWVQPGGGSQWIHSFYHGTAIGRFLVRKFWNVLREDVVTLNKYDSHPETAKLKPWSNPFFTGNSLSILNYDSDIFEYVRNGTIKLHFADITSLSPGTVNLSNGETLATDALVCCTGWKHLPSIQFLPGDIDVGLGHDLTPAETKKISAVDNEILSQFPSLKNPPTTNSKLKPMHESRSSATTVNEALPQISLYRFMIPPTMTSTRDIAFAGAMQSIGGSSCAQIQALWITAYLNNDLLLPSQSTVDHETLLHTRFAKLRTPHGFGSRFPDSVFDSVSYFDMLLRDLGVRYRRKKGVLREIFGAYGPADYRGVVDEWLGLEGREGKKSV